MNKLKMVIFIIAFTIPLSLLIISDFKNKTIERVIIVLDKYKVPYHGSDILVIVNQGKHEVIESYSIFEDIELNKKYKCIITINCFGTIRNTEIKEVK